LFWFLTPVDRSAIDDQPGKRLDGQRVEGEPLVAAVPLADDQLHAAADRLLALVDPERSDTAYFPAFARDRLRWMSREHAAGRLEVGLLTDTGTGRLPAEVLMAASNIDGKPTIVIAKPRFTKFLIDGGATAPPFRPQQKNDFAVALVHEIVHLQNAGADPRNPELRMREESRVWREVSLNVVRPLRVRNQPIHARFKEVDDALRACHDELPCPPLTRLVRMTQ
jgi:hypothetical protein